MKKVKIGVVGVGYLGRIHAAKYSSMEDVELVGVADVCQNSAQEIANKYNVRMFLDYQEMLECVDAVSIVVPTRKHFEVASECLEKGMDVFLEKPMTTTVSDADKLVDMAESCHRIMQIGHIEQFNPAILAMEQYITTPLFIEAQRIHSFNSRGADVDVVLDLMIHDIDIILNVVKSPLKFMHSVGIPVVTSTSDIANTRLVFENGCTANVSASRISKINSRKLRIFQPKSYISVDYASKEIMVVEHTGKINDKGFPIEKITNSSFQEKDALETELRAFILNVQQRVPPKIDGRAGRRALKTSLAIIDQMKNHLEEHNDLFL